MEVSHKRSTLLKKLIIPIAAILVWSSFIFPSQTNAAVINDPQTDYLDMTSPIVLEFDKVIQFDSSLIPTPNVSSGPHHGITLKELGSGNPVAFTLQVMPTNQRKLIITPNPTPPSGSGFVAWDRNKNYILEITNYIVTDTSGAQVLPTLTTPLTYSIGTNFLTFERLMSGAREINYIITDYTPRNILVKSPVRYIEQLNIIHKRQAIAQGNTTESVTNIDLIINDKAIYNSNGDIRYIEVTPKRNGSALQQTKVLDYLNLTPNSGRRTYDFAFTRLPDTTAFDIEIVLYDEAGIAIDTQIVKVPYDSNSTSTIKQKTSYRFAGKTFTLYDLINKPNDLQTLLNENLMRELKVQVVQQ
ncbi:hypothetical protein ACFYKT_08815 [Cytobacillus sp. FJAT-53684]|uniref:SbsA Ig-like domain-containing protein n=1 Tax=Cytobacillus mangrovibacter TaxID=3299024 RepID=A0ABW6K122_9BACI